MNIIHKQLLTWITLTFSGLCFSMTPNVINIYVSNNSDSDSIKISNPTLQGPGSEYIYPPQPNTLFGYTLKPSKMGFATYTGTEGNCPYTLEFTISSKNKDCTISLKCIEQTTNVGNNTAVTYGVFQSPEKSGSLCGNINFTPEPTLNTSSRVYTFQIKYSQTN